MIMWFIIEQKYIHISKELHKKYAAVGIFTFIDFFYVHNILKIEQYRYMNLNLKHILSVFFYS